MIQKKYLSSVCFLLLLIFTQAVAAETCPDSQQIFLDEQWRMNMAVRDISWEANNPTKLSKALTMPACAQKQLSSDQKLQIYKENYTRLHTYDNYPFGERKAYFQALLQNSGPKGKEFIGALDIVHSESAPTDVKRLTISNMDGRDAVNVVSKLYNNAVNSWSSIDPEKRMVDFEQIQHLAMEFITDPSDMLQLATSGNHGDRMPLWMSAVRTRIESLEAKDLNPKLVCSMYTSGLLATSPWASRKGLDSDQTSKEAILKKIKSLTEKTLFQDVDCNGAKMSEYRKFFEQSYATYKGAAISAKTEPIKPAAVKVGKCKIDEVRKWFSQQVTQNYQWPAMYLGGKGLNSACQVNLRIVSDSIRVKDVKGKKTKAERISQYRVEVLDPETQKVAVGTVRTDLLANTVDAQIVSWKIFNAPQLKPTTIDAAPAAAPIPPAPSRR